MPNDFLQKPEQSDLLLVQGHTKKQISTPEQGKTQKTEIAKILVYRLPKHPEG